MPQYIAFLRGMNLGKRRVKMDVLRAIFVSLKFTDVETFIASGNVIFASPEKDESRLIARIERALEKKLGYRVDTFIRTRAELAAATAHATFPPEMVDDPAATLHVAFLHEDLGPKWRKDFAACRTPVDELRANGREFYWLCRVKSHESVIWATAAIKALQLPTSTMRNLKTLRKLVELYPASDGKP